MCKLLGDRSAPSPTWVVSMSMNPESYSEAKSAIFTEITQDDPEIRSSFMAHFSSDVVSFSEAIAESVVLWRMLLDKGIKDQERAYISGLTHAAITLQTLSMKLLLSGQMVAAGNAFRQVLESSCTALLCSSKQLNVLQRFVQDQYSTSKAVADVLRHWQKLGLIKDALPQLKDSENFYHKYSHVTRLTLANFISLEAPDIYVGASFDTKKLDAYRKEVSGRVGFSHVFSSCIHAIDRNLRQW
jgi:hypothetical protein